jgi:biopolymer transport protein ExbD
MKFRRTPGPEPEINLIPFIDVLLVVLIFLMLSTSYSKLTEVQLNLPVADTDQQQQRPHEVRVSISREGRYSVNGEALSGRDVPALMRTLMSVSKGMENPLVVISADAQASHQSVMAVMEAARRSNLNQLTFAAQSSSSKNK